MQLSKSTLLLLLCLCVRWGKTSEVQPLSPPPKEPPPANLPSRSAPDESGVKAERLSRIEEEDETTPAAVTDDPFAGPQLRIERRPATPPTPCSKCSNTGRREPETTLKSFVLFEDDAPPEPAEALGWTPCPECEFGKRAAQFFEAERKRLKDRAEFYASHEKETGLAFLDFETRHVTGHFQASPVEARECARQFERLAGILRERGANSYLAGSPVKQRLVVCENEERYTAYLENFARRAGHNDENWLELARKTASFGSRGLTVVRRDLVVPPKGAGIEHMTVFAFAHMLIRECARNKAPAWFAEGFSSLCESLVLENPRCYSVRYELNRLDFEVSWAQAMGEALRKGKCRKWETLFTLEPVGMSALDYQQCWSAVRYLYQTDGQAFGKLPALFVEGQASDAALTKAYETPVEKLEAAWRSRASLGR